MDKKQIALIFSIVVVLGVTVYFFTQKEDEKKVNDSDSENDNAGNNNGNENINNDAPKKNALSIVSNNAKKLQFFAVENDLSKSVFAKWPGSNNIYPLTRSFAISKGIDPELSNVVLITREQCDTYNLCEAIKEGEVPN